MTPPPEIPARVLGPAAATGDRARALVQKEANNKAAEAEKKAAKLTADSEQNWKRPKHCCKKKGKKDRGKTKRRLRFLNREGPARTSSHLERKL